MLFVFKRSVWFCGGLHISDALKPDTPKSKDRCHGTSEIRGARKVFPLTIP